MRRQSQLDRSEDELRLLNFMSLDFLQLAAETLALQVTVARVAEQLGFVDDSRRPLCPECRCVSKSTDASEFHCDNEDCGSTVDVVDYVARATNSTRQEAVGLVLKIKADRHELEAVQKKLLSGNVRNNAEQPKPGSRPEKTNATNSTSIWGIVNNVRKHPNAIAPTELVGTYYRDILRYRLIGKGEESLLARQMETHIANVANIAFRTSIALRELGKLLDDVIAGLQTPSRLFDADTSESPELILDAVNSVKAVSEIQWRLTPGSLVLRQYIASVFRLQPKRKVVARIVKLIIRESDSSAGAANNVVLGQVGDETVSVDKLKLEYHSYERARDSLAVANLRLALHIAIKYRASKCPLLDIIQAGNMGLLRACDKFDYRRGTKFATYATWWIRQCIQRYIDDQSRIIRIPIEAARNFRQLHTAKIKHWESTGHSPSFDELLELTEFDTSTLRKLFKFDRRIVRVKRLASRRDRTLIDNQPCVIERLCQSELSELVSQSLRTLDTRAATVLRSRFGLEGEEEQTLEVVGERLGVTRERIRQIEMRALEKLAKRLEIKTASTLSRFNVIEPIEDESATLDDDTGDVPVTDEDGSE